MPKWRQGLWQKFGLLIPYYSSEDQRDENIWLHAVSFGEVKTIEPLVYELQKAFPEYRLCLSTGTRTGQELAQKLFTNKQNNLRLEKELLVFYCPFDFYFAMKAFFETLQPKFLLIAETEIWPEMLLQAKQRKVPAFLVNARLTDKSVKKYKFIRPLFAPVIRSFRKIFAQSFDDKKRFLQIGASEEKIEVLNNLKFDSMQVIDEEKVVALRNLLNLQAETIVLMAGSTHSGEEELVCEVFKKILAEYADKDIRLIIAPRHLDRVSSVKEICGAAGLSFSRRTELSENRKFSRHETLILDTMGELTSFYAIAQIVFLGGTWANIGGHNPLEPAAYGMPIFVGPHTYKIKDLVEQLKALRCLRQIDSANELTNSINELIRSGQYFNPELKHSLKSSMGVSTRTITSIKENLN